MKHRFQRFTRWQKIISITALMFGLFLAGLAVIYTLATAPPSDLSTQRLVKDAVEKHYMLPSNEEPALLTVLDKNKLSSTILKEKAEEGDKILLYQTNKLLIIYRPSTDRIVSVSPLIIDDIEPSE